MRTTFFRLLFFNFLFCSSSCFGQHKTEWFKNARYGVFVHYLNSLQNSSLPWNQGQKTSWDSCVNGFDVKKFAEEVKETGAGYVIFSLQQSDEFFCAPNSTFEKLTGLQRGYATSHRDLINNLYLALKQKNIQLLLYVTGNGPFKNWSAMERLTNHNFHNRVVNNAYQVNKQYVQTWSKVLAEFSVRYKDKVKGWWVDGAYPFIGYNDTLITILKNSLKSGNTKSIIAFNPSPKDTVSYYSKLDDYTAGEIYNYQAVPKSRFIKGVQWHAATFLGKDWANPGLRFTDNDLYNYIYKCNANGGVVSLDICVLRDGSIDEGQKRQLARLKLKLKLK
jgi:hypothetical protein